MKEEEKQYVYALATVAAINALLIDVKQVYIYDCLPACCRYALLLQL